MNSYVLISLRKEYFIKVQNTFSVFIVCNDILVPEYWSDRFKSSDFWAAE